MLYSALAVICVLGVLIFFHELGHFMVARILGIGVKSFSLGFGPRIWGTKRGMTEYKLSAFPLGGYVRLVGESSGEEDEEDEIFPPEYSFSLRPAWQRMLVVGAGPVFNFVLAWFIYFVLFWGYGQFEMLPKVGELSKDGAAVEAGIKAGDMITAVDNSPISYWSELTRLIQEEPGPVLNLEVLRDNTVLHFAVSPRIQERKNIFGEIKKVPMIGIVASGETVHIPVGPFKAGVEGAKQTWKLIVLTLEGLVKLVERVVPIDTVGGPIMIAQMVGEQARNGLVNLLGLTALISINLGLLNLLPIPVLDGGHLLFYAIEIVRGRPLEEKLQQIAIRIGLSLLLALMVFTIMNDLWRIAK